MSNDDFNDAVNQGGEYVRPADIMGHLLIVFPIGYIDHFPTVNSRGDRPSDAIACDVVDLDQADANTGQPGKLIRNQKFLQSQLIMSLRPMIGKKVLGRMNKGVAKPGFNPPWVLDPMSGDPQAVDRARAWMQAHPDFSPSEFVPWTPRAPQAPQQPPHNPHQQPTLQYGSPPQPQYQPSQQAPQQPYPYQPQQPQYQQQQQPQYQPPDPWANDYAQFQQAAPPPQAPPPQYVPQAQQAPSAPPPMVPVAGTRPLTSEESTVLERLRRQRELEAQDPAQLDERQRFGF